MRVNPVGVLSRQGDFLAQQVRAQRDRLQSEPDEVVIARGEFVGLGLGAWIGNMRDGGAGEVGDDGRESVDAMRLGNLIHHPHAIADVVARFYCQPDTSDRIVDIDERARLSAATVDGQWVVDGGLYQKTIQHGAEIAVIVESIDEPIVQSGLDGLCSPNYSLVKIGDSQCVILCIELK